MIQTVKKIAATAGVSPATVSRVLNGFHGVSTQKKQQVLAALERGNMTPVQRRRQSKHSAQNIGLLLLQGAERDPAVVLSKIMSLSLRLPAGWTLSLLPSNILPSELKTQHLSENLAGLILAGHEIGSAALNSVIRGIPHVWLNSYASDGHKKTVLMGNELAGRIAARHLIASGIKSALAFTLPSINPGLAARIEGFRYEFFTAELPCRTLALSLPRRLMLETASDEELEAALLQAVAEQWNTVTPAPDGLFSPEDRLTALFYRAWTKLQRGTMLPMVSCNYSRSYLAGLLPRPASIDLGADSLAAQALEELLHRISGLPGKSDDIAVITTPRLIPGELC